MLKKIFEILYTIFPLAADMAALVCVIIDDIPHATFFLVLGSIIKSTRHDH